MVTVTRSFRLDDKLLQNLARMAKKYGLTENQLVASWLSWRIGFDPLIPTFDGLMLSTEVFESILNGCNAHVLELRGLELGKKHVVMSRMLFEAVGKQLTFVKYVKEILSRRARWFRIEGEIDEASRELILIHKLGIRWSVFLKAFLMGAYESTPRMRLTVEITDTAVILRLNPQL